MSAFILHLQGRNCTSYVIRKYRVRIIFHMSIYSSGSEDPIVIFFFYLRSSKSNVPWLSPRLSTDSIRYSDRLLRPPRLGQSDRHEFVMCWDFSSMPRLTVTHNDVKNAYGPVSFVSIMTDTSTNFKSSYSESYYEKINCFVNQWPLRSNWPGN
jgi:hypothetical protein